MSFTCTCKFFYGFQDFELIRSQFRWQCTWLIWSCKFYFLSTIFNAKQTPWNKRSNSYIFSPDNSSKLSIYLENYLQCNSMRAWIAADNMMLSVIAIYSFLCTHITVFVLYMYFYSNTYFNIDADVLFVKGFLCSSNSCLPFWVLTTARSHEVSYEYRGFYCTSVMLLVIVAATDFCLLYLKCKQLL